MMDSKPDSASPENGRRGSGKAKEDKGKTKAWPKHPIAEPERNIIIADDESDDYSDRLMLVINIVNGALKSEKALKRGCLTTKQVLDYLVDKNDPLIMRVKAKRDTLVYYLNKLALAGAVKKYRVMIGKSKDCWALGDKNAILLKPSEEPANLGEAKDKSTEDKTPPPKRPLNKFKPWWPEGTVT